jgi:hypothetical protein
VDTRRDVPSKERNNVRFVTYVAYSDDGFKNMYDTDAEEWLPDAREVIRAHGGD